MENADAAASNGTGDLSDSSWRLFAGLAEASLIQQRRNGEDPDRADTLPRVKVRAMGRSGKLFDPSGELKELYDPDSVGQQFYHPAEEVNRHAYVPVRTQSGQYIDPLGGMKHRIQLVDHFEKGQPVLKEHWCETGEQLASLAQTREYRRSRILESTGDWVFNGDAERYVKAVIHPLRECYYESKKPIGDRKLREVAGYDPFAFGGNGDGTSAQSVTAAMDTEFIPILGGPFQKQLYLYAHWEASAKCFEMKNHSELAKATCDIVTDFALGRGVTWKIRNDAARLIWIEFWERNHMEQRLRQFCSDSVWQGELLVRKDQVLRGFLRVRSIDPSAIYEIVTAPQDLETVYLYQLQYPCLHGDTSIALLDGTHATIHELAKRTGPYWVYSYDHEKKRIVPGLATKTWKAGKKRCVKVTLDNGKAVVASYDHPFLMRDGRYVEAEKLKLHDSLMPLYRRIGYEKVWQPETGWEPTHHMVAGKPLRGHAVHHKNHRQTDNRPGNLETMSVKEHNLTHSRLPRRAMAAIVERHTLGALEKLSASQKANYAANPDRARRAREQAVARWADPEWRARMTQKIRASRLNPSARLKKAWEVSKDITPEERKRRSDRMKAYWADPAHKASLRTRLRSEWKNPESRAARSKKISDSFDREQLEDAARVASGTNHKVISVEPAGEHDVYDLQVENYHNFALACGVFTHNTQYQLPYTDFKGVHLDIPLQQYVVEQLPPTEVWHGKLNVTAYEKWGRSDFFCALGTLKRLRDWMNAVTLRDLLQANLVWKMKIHGDDSDVQAFVNDPSNSQLPPFAGTWVENDGLDLEPMHVDVATGGRGMGQGSAGNFLIAMYAASQQFPSNYFNLQSGGSTRATALVASEPVAKKIATRQQFLRGLLDHLFEEVMKCAMEAGRIDSKTLGGDDADPEWTFPGTFEEDRGAKFRDVSAAVDRRAISHRRAATVMSQELGFEEYDYDEEQAEIAKDLKNPNLQAPLLPVEPPTQKSAPPSELGAEPDTAGGKEDIKGADANMQARRNSRISSGTGATPPVREAGRLRLRGLSESDRSSVRDAVRSGASGQVILGIE